LRISGDPAQGDDLLAEVAVTNLSGRPGVAVVQIHQRAPQSRGGWHRLAGFAKLRVSAHATARARIRLTFRDLSFRDAAAGAFALPADGVHIGVGTSSAERPEWRTPG
jgi:hypothetical protein